MVRQHEETAGELDFGAELRRWRTKRELSLAGLSRLVHYSKGYLSKIETGDKPATPDVARRCDEVLAAGGALLDLVPVSIPAQRPSREVDECPYPGLAAFDTADADWFFGRERVTRELIARLTEQLTTGDHRLVLLVGPSGAGKSSLLRAGLLPALARGVLPGGHWSATLFTPGADLLAQLSQGSTERTVLVVDQFEEVFTLCAPEDRARFIAALAQEDAGLVVIGMRADFYGHLLAHPELAAAVPDRQVTLGPMSEEELRDAITRPAQRAGYDLEPGLVELLLRDLSGPTGTPDPGALPLLAHALLTTWQNRDGRVLTVAAYQRTGGLHTAIATTAERAYARLDPATRTVARRVVLRLVQVGQDTGQTRRRASLAQLRVQFPGPELDRLLDEFVCARLLTTDTQTVEVTHEALLGAWPRLRGWIDTDRAGLHAHQRLAEAAETWQTAGRDPALLLQGAQLALASGWAADHPDDPTALEQELLHASHRERKRGVRRLRRMIALLTVLVLLATTATAIAWWQGARAAEQQRDAARQRDLALSQNLAALATDLRATNPAIAAQLAAAAYHRAPTLEARSAVLSTPTPTVTHLRSQGDWIPNLAFSPDGRLLALATTDGVTELWDAKNPRRRTALATLAGAACCLAFNPATGALLAGGRLWDVTDPARPAPLGELPLPWLRAAAFALDGTLATTGADHNAQLWDLTDPRAPRLLRTITHGTDIGNVAAITADGATLLTAHDGGRAALWNTATGELIDVIPCSAYTFTRAAFSRDGRHIALANNDGDTWLTSLDANRQAADPILLPGGEVTWGMAFSPDGTRLLTGGNEQAVRVWDVPTQTLLTELPHPNRVAGLALTSDGTTLVTGGVAGNFYLWPEPLATLTPGHVPLNALALSPDRRRAVTSAGRDATLWRLDDHGRPTPLGALTGGHPDPIAAAALSADHRLAATVGAEQDVVLWDTSDPTRPVFRSRLPVFDVAGAVAFRHDGKILVSGDNAGYAIVWDISDPAAPEKLYMLESEFRNVNAVDISADGRLLATGDTNHGVGVWDLTNPRAPRETTPRHRHAESVTGVRFTPDATVLVSTAEDWTAVVWSRHTATRLRGHTAAIWAADLDPQGHKLVTTGGDNTDRLWDIHDPAHPRQLAALTAPSIGPAAFAADGRTVLTAGGHTLRTWHTDPQTVLRAICAGVGVPLTPDEWTDYVGATVPYTAPCPN